MVSTGQDLRMAVWDIRMFKEVNNYFVRRPGSTVSISDRGLVAVGWGTQTSIWRGLFDKSKQDQEKIKSPYMGWGGDGKTIERVRWCPFEDVLGISHDKGFSSIIVPGAGEPNFDALEVDPFENTRQRQEGEVKALLNKIQPEMISLDPNFIGNLDRASNATRQKEKDLDAVPEDPLETMFKKKARGRNSSLRKHLRRKQKKNVIDEQRLKIDAMREARKNKDKSNTERQKEELGPALARFVRKEPR